MGHPIVDKPIRADVSDSASIATYGEMVLDLNNPWLQDYVHASAYSALLLAFLKDPKRTIEVQLDQRPDLQYTFDIMDKIHFQSAKLSIDETLHVGRIEHRWQAATGQNVNTTLVMRPRLTSTVAIGDDPRDPDLPYIPPGDDGGGSPPTGGDGGDTPPGGDCLTDPNAVANGPYRLPGIPGYIPIRLDNNGILSYTQRYDGAWVIRPVGAINFTYAQVFGEWSYYDNDTGEWYGETTSTWWRVIINGNLTGENQTITDSGSGMRTIHFHPGGPTPIYSVEFQIDAGTFTGSDYSYGAIISTGSVNGTNASGTEITGLTAGNLYSLEGYSGGYGNGQTTVYIISVSQSSTFSQPGEAYAGTLSSVFYQDIGTTALYIEQDGVYGRIFFQAAGTSVWVRCWDNNAQYADNSGAITWALRGAVVTDEIKRWNITGMNFGNICTI
jgi:hypothetical protein